MEVLALKIGHICPDIGIQRIDDHLPVGRACDLDSSVHEAWSWWGTFPCRVLSNVLGVWEEIESGAPVELDLTHFSPVQELFTSGIECPVEQCQEDNGIFGQDLARAFVERAEDSNALEILFDLYHVA